MKTVLHSAAIRRAAPESSHPSLEHVTRPTVTTGEAAHYLNRRPQTLRGWACQENGPVRPIRINGRLAWPVADIRRLVGVEGV
ncbi:helix-turn-helix domain-containing protein [Comamonas flocculans]|uniref:Helix-turn-helix domain-containing protein n=1 Tax=Comamonas flocculans TaxID=2597701 RepID=A0A5B8RSK3_9BURK|nr:helix-turn-helix domain-containing protein [Comamonas flocculans]QEA12093.1 helix-turn-helix domain-containing protein [Comamonas flocculans]